MHTARCLLPATCYLLHVTCYMLHATCYMLLMQRATVNQQGDLLEVAHIQIAAARAEARRQAAELEASRASVALGQVALEASREEAAETLTARFLKGEVIALRAQLEGVRTELQTAYDYAKREAAGQFSVQAPQEDRPPAKDGLSISFRACGLREVDDLQAALQQVPFKLQPQAWLNSNLNLKLNSNLNLDLDPSRNISSVAEPA